MTRIESLLRKEIGLDSSSIGSSLIERAARLRMKANGVKTVDDYLHLLETSRDERRELVEAVVVNETWFFRDNDAFKAFVQLVLKQWLPRQAAGPLRLLSVPCSSGEEPYSLAMALIDAGLPTERFAVDAVDISARILARAKRAVFGKNSFRGRDLAFRDRHFQPAKEGYALDMRVCGCVHFYEDNILSNGFMGGRASYDFIFCRNLLIYFDRPTQAQALKQLQQLLAPQGVLFVGPAELPLFLDHGFLSINLPMAFACRYPGPGEKHDTVRHRRASRPATPRPRPIPPAPVPAKPVPSHGAAKSPAPAAPAPATQPPLPANLSVAHKLADAGQLKEAEAICEAVLREQGPSAPAYYLIGLVRDAGGDPQAGDFYRKALYLDPNHYESLWQMALISEKNGDVAGARAYRRRAERAQTATKS